MGEQLTPAEVKQLKKRVEALKFSANETPEKWSYKMQLLLNMWKRIPADKRSGTIADLSDTLCLLYTSPSPRDATLSRMPSSA